MTAPTSTQPKQATRIPAVQPSAVTPARVAMLQRKCACGGTPGPTGECEECRKKRLQRKAATSSSPTTVPSVVNNVLSSPGRPLDSGTRDFMEPRFGHDFSDVRVHDDARAADSARAVDAHAYTVGQDIVFDSGRYQPDTTPGRELLAHELAHTVQQRGLQRSASDASIPTNAEDQRLEREADDIAAAVMRGPAPTTPSAIAAMSAGRPVVSRVKKKAKGVPVATTSAYMATNHVVEPDDEFNAGGKTLQSFDVDTLILPATKGPKARDFYDSLAKARGLQATLDVSGARTKAALWQERAGTDDLRDRWLQRMGWPGGADANDLWAKAGGDSEFPKVGGATCQMDHIVELQVGGNNTNENIQALDATQNRDSGGAIKQEVMQLAENVLAEPALSNGNADQISLRFKSVKLNGTPEKLPAKANCAPKTPTCLSVEHCAQFVKVPKGKGPAQSTEPYELRAGGAATTVQVPNNFRKAATAKADIYADATNQAAGELMPGFLLETLHHTKNADNIHGKIDDRPKTRLPITIDDKRAEPIVFDVARANGKVTLNTAKSAKNIHFSYPYLSPGEITKLNYDETRGLEFRGHINTRIPFLGKLDVMYEGGVFRLEKDLNEKTLKSPIPGTRITKAALALDLWPELKPSGTFGFAAGPKGRELFDADFTVFKDSAGLAAKGTLNVNIPGVDKAQGDVNYSAGEWTGAVVIRSEQIKKKFKYIKSGEVSITFAQGKLTPTGTVEVDLPYSQGVTATLGRENGTWMFEGHGMIDPPRLSRIGIRVKYDGTNFEGTVAPGPKFTLLGFTGGIESLTYRNGKFSGTGSLEFKKGRAQGKLSISLLDNGKFTGRGDIAYQVSENLLVTGSAELDKQEKLHIAGTLRYLKPIEIPHTTFGGGKTFFKAGISIPIPGLSLGPAVGLKARIDGELSAGVSIGPALIRNIEITAAFNPLEDDPNLEIAGGAEFYMPAKGFVSGMISAGIMLDLFVGDVTGGLAIRVRADLDGHFSASVKAKYTVKRYSFDTTFELMLALILTFGIDAFLRARAGWGPFSVSTSKNWTLAEKKIDTGLKFGLRAPMRYASDEPFQAPSWDSIEVIKPTLDFGNLLDRVISSSPPVTKEH